MGDRPIAPPTQVNRQLPIVMERDPRVDAYIANAAPFARPILERVRTAVHEAVPGVEETIKWGMPFFLDGRPLLYMAAFTEHCGVGLWKRGSVVAGIAEGEKAGDGAVREARLRA